MSGASLAPECWARGADTAKFTHGDASFAVRAMSSVVHSGGRSAPALEPREREGAKRTHEHGGLLTAERVHGATRIECRLVQPFVLDDIAHPRQDGLVKQRVGDHLVGRSSEHSRHRRLLGKSLVAYIAVARSLELVTSCAWIGP